MDKEQKWLEQRVGMITASELGNITSASGKIIDGNISYIRAKRWERKRGFAHRISAKPMEIGNEQEPYIIAWCRANLRLPEIIYSKDLPEIPFWIAPDCPLGASPDAYTPDEKIVIEAKTLVGATSIEFFDDDFTPYEEKKLAVWKDHGDQLCGQWISNPKVEEIWVVKYIYQDDDVLKDLDSPNAFWRGLVFKFVRKDYENSIEDMRQRVILYDQMIDAPINATEFKDGRWCLKDGKLYHKPKEEK